MLISCRPFSQEEVTGLIASAKTSLVKRVRKRA